MEQNRLNNAQFIIPCFNEGMRFDSDAYSKSLNENNSLHILFVNDGSSDDTISVLEKLKSLFPKQVDVLDLPVNKGKAEAVRRGMLKILNEKPQIEYLGYFDADLATSLEEGILLFEQLMDNKQIKFAFGSRISKVGSTIVRKTYRHFIGRIIATFISNILQLRVYDTQCGAKVFTRDIAQFVFEQPFISKWLFDVEIFARILCKPDRYSEKNMVEIPLIQWIDHDGSKVKWSYSFKLFFDLLRIKKSYPALKQRPKMI